MSMFDIFKTTPDTPAVVAPQQQPAPQPGQQPVVAPPGNIPNPQVTAQESAVTAPNGVVPAQPAIETKEPETPLDEFKNLWETDPTKTTPVAANTELTQADLSKVMAKADFSSVITPENLTAIAAGGEDAQKAFSNSLNAVAQQVMIQSTLVNNKLTEQAVQKAIDTYQAKLPDLLRSQAASDHLRTSNPLFSKPAVKPVIQATQAQLLQKFPNATHTEITKMTENFIIALGEIVKPVTAVNDNQAGSETDWDAFMSSPS